MPVGVRARHELSQVAPVLLRPIDVEFVGECPPDVAKRSEASHDIAHVGIRLNRIEAGEAPGAAIIRMKENQVGLQAESLELPQALFVVSEIGRIETLEVNFAIRAAQVWKRHFSTEAATSRQHHEADLVEGRVTE